MTEKNYSGTQMVIFRLVSEDGIPMRIAREIAHHDDWRERSAAWLQEEGEVEALKAIEIKSVNERRRQIDSGEIRIGSVRRPPIGSALLWEIAGKPARLAICSVCGSTKQTRAIHHSIRCCDRRMMVGPFEEAEGWRKGILAAVESGEYDLPAEVIASAVRGLQNANPQGSSCSLCGRPGHSKTRCMGPDVPPRRRGRRARKMHVRNPITGYLERVE